MNALPQVFLDEARAEFDAAADWYEQKRAGLGADFIAHVDNVIERISATPRMHAIVYKDVRRAVVKKFPYVVLYQVETDRLVIVSVFHCSRDPATWKARV